MLINFKRLHTCKQEMETATKQQELMSISDVHDYRCNAINVRNTFPVGRFRTARDLMIISADYPTFGQQS